MPVAASPTDNALRLFLDSVTTVWTKIKNNATPSCNLFHAHYNPAMKSKLTYNEKQQAAADKRRARIGFMLASGNTWEQIAARMNVSRQRVQQLWAGREK